MAASSAHQPDTDAGADLRVSNGSGLSMTVSSFGARLVELLVPDRDGHLDNVVLGFDDREAYQRHVDLYFGGTIGRVAGRISGGSFVQAGRLYRLARNEGTNALHGGAHRSFDRVEWSARAAPTDHGPGIVLEYVSPDLEEGFPGNLTVRVEYALSEQNELWNVLRAWTDAPTPVNLTNHTYWTLNGGRPGSILDHELMISADYVVSTGADLVPTGGLDPVAGTALDFRRSRSISARLPVGTEPWPGFDNAYVLSDHDATDVVASLWDPVTGRAMDLTTTEPSLQVYTSNRLRATQGRAGGSYGPGSAICLEPQRMPDAPNRPEFAPITLGPGEEYRHVSCYRFSVR